MLEKRPRVGERKRREVESSADPQSLEQEKEDDQGGVGQQRPESPAQEVGEERGRRTGARDDDVEAERGLMGRGSGGHLTTPSEITSLR